MVYPCNIFPTILIIIIVFITITTVQCFFKSPQGVVFVIINDPSLSISGLSGTAMQLLPIHCGKLLLDV